MTREERNNKLKHLITCMKCEVNGKFCNENCPTQYDAGSMEEIIRNLEEISKILEQEPGEADLDIRVIKDLPSVTPTQKWIPCTERLPEKSGRYLVTRGFNALFRLWNRVYIVNYSDLMGLKKEKIWWSGNVGKSDFEKFDDVIAWRCHCQNHTGKKGQKNERSN